MEELAVGTMKNPMELVHEIVSVFSDWRTVVKILQGRLMSHQLRQRIALMISGANKSRYCSIVHTYVGTWFGVPKEEAMALLEGQTDKTPKDDLPAVQYVKMAVRSTKDTNGPDEELLRKTYGKEFMAGLRLFMRMIRIGNSIMNGLDYVLSNFLPGVFSSYRPINLIKKRAAQK